MGVSLRKSGEVGIHVYNAIEESKLLSQKVASAGVLVYPNTVVEMDKYLEEVKD